VVSDEEKAQWTERIEKIIREEKAQWTERIEKIIREEKDNMRAIIEIRL
jgi:hypothetical protein